MSKLKQLTDIVMSVLILEVVTELVSPKPFNSERVARFVDRMDDHYTRKAERTREDDE